MKVRLMVGSDFTHTTSTLLQRLHDPADASAWSRIDDRYRRIIIGSAMRLGLKQTDAEDVAQEVLARFSQAYRAGQYDREKGRLGAWLLSMVRFRVVDALRARAQRREVGTGSEIMVLPDQHSAEQVWETERRRVILMDAIHELRSTSETSDQSIRIFEMLVLNRKKAPEVAQELGISPGVVYTAKNRVAERLRGIVERLEQAFEDDRL